MKVFKISSLLLLVGVIGFGEALKCYQCNPEDIGPLCNDLTVNATASAHFLKECSETATDCFLVKVRSTRNSRNAYQMVGRGCFEAMADCEEFEEMIKNTRYKQWNFRCETCNTDGCNKT